METTIKNRIQILGKTKGLSLTRIENLLGFGNGTITKWDKSSPSVDKLRQVAILLNVSVDFLLRNPLLINSYERFEQLLRENNVTPYRVSKETGIPTSTLSSWKKGTYTPKNDKLQLISDYFSVSLEWLLGNTDIKEKVNSEKYDDDSEVARLINEIKNDPELRLLLDAKRSLSKEDMENIINITKSLLRKERGFED